MNGKRVFRKSDEAILASSGRTSTRIAMATSILASIMRMDPCLRVFRANCKDCKNCYAIPFKENTFLANVCHVLDVHWMLAGYMNLD